MFLHIRRQQLGKSCIRVITDFDAIFLFSLEGGVHVYLPSGEQIFLIILTLHECTIITSWAADGLTDSFVSAEDIFSEKASSVVEKHLLVLSGLCKK